MQHSAQLSPAQIQYRPTQQQRARVYEHNSKRVKRAVLFALAAMSTGQNAITSIVALILFAICLQGNTGVGKGSGLSEMC